MDITEESDPKPAPVVRRVDAAGRISIIKHRYDIGRYLAGQKVTVESSDGLIHVSRLRDKGRSHCQALGGHECDNEKRHLRTVHRPSVIRVSRSLQP